MSTLTPARTQRLEEHELGDRTSVPSGAQNDESTPIPTEVDPRSKDTDLHAVLICFSCFMVIFTTCGTLFSFGVFQELYEGMSHQPDTPFTGASPAVIDLIGTLGVSFQTLFAPFATAWTKRFSPRMVISLGGLTFFVACLLASYSTKLWEFILTQGLLLGVATCMAYIPAVTVAPTWYTARRGLAMGIILAGTGVGGVAWAPVIHALNERYGYRMTLRISGAISGGLIVISASVLRWDSVTQRRLDMENGQFKGGWMGKLFNIPLLDWRVANSKKFIAQLFSGSCQAAAYYTPVFFFSTYARTLGYNAKTGANFIAITNACNAIGKIIVGTVADRYGRLNVLFATTLLSALASFTLWLPSSLDKSLTTSRGLFIAYSIAYGLFASPYVSLFAAALVELFGPVHFASVNGSLYMARGMTTLLGTPLAGVLIRGSTAEASPASYWRTTVMVGCLLAAATVGSLWARFENRKTIQG